MKSLSDPTDKVKEIQDQSESMQIKKHLNCQRGTLTRDEKLNLSLSDVGKQNSEQG